MLSKILEKHVHDALMDFLFAYNLLHKTQLGFRPSHSCETALIGMMSRWLDAMNNGSMIGVDMVDFKILKRLLTLWILAFYCKN